MARGCGILRNMLEKCYTTVNGLCKVDSGENLQRKENCRESLSLLREKLSHSDQNVGRNMDSKGHSDLVSDINKEMRDLLTGKLRKGETCYKVAKILAKLCLFANVL